MLVVDDDPCVATAMRRILARRYHVTLAYRAVDALDRIKAGERFELILSDMIMPGMDGRAFHRALCEAAPDQAARLVFVTAAAGLDEVRRFLAEARRPWIDKPFELPEFEAFVGAEILRRGLLSA